MAPVPTSAAARTCTPTSGGTRNAGLTDDLTHGWLLLVGVVEGGQQALQVAEATLPVGVLEGLVLGEDVDEALAEVVAVAEEDLARLGPGLDHVDDARIAVEAHRHQAGGAGGGGGGSFSMITRRPTHSLGTSAGGSPGKVATRTGMPSTRSARTVTLPE